MISSYMCDHKTADAEFLLSKAKYKAITGREQKRDADILCYQIRQAFVPGEVTPEDANRVGYETAMRWTKGKYAFFVATHIDRAHIHNHIYYNSTALDCTRKFRDFLGSARAVRRLSDRVCLENGLSYIAHPKLKSKGKYKHYGQWLGGGKPLTFQERLKAQIDICLAEKPPDMDAFLQAMAAAGYEVKHGRGGVISFRAEGQERFTRLRSSTLGAGYGQEDIQAVIEGRTAPSESRTGSPRKVNLIITTPEPAPCSTDIRPRSTAGNITRSMRPILKSTGRRRPLSGASLPGRSSPKWTRSKPNGKNSPRRKRPLTRSTAPPKRTCGSLLRRKAISTICSA